MFNIIENSVIYPFLKNEFDLSTADNAIIKNEIITVAEYESTLAGKGRAKKEARDTLRQLMKRSR